MGEGIMEHEEYHLYQIGDHLRTNILHPSRDLRAARDPAITGYEY